MKPIACAHQLQPTSKCRYHNKIYQHTHTQRKGATDDIVIFIGTHNSHIFIIIVMRSQFNRLNRSPIGVFFLIFPCIFSFSLSLCHFALSRIQICSHYNFVYIFNYNFFLTPAATVVASSISHFHQKNGPHFQRKSRYIYIYIDSDEVK